MAVPLKKGVSVILSMLGIKKKYQKIVTLYLLIALLCFFFAFIYELFSHQVYSNFLILAGLFPLIGGALVNALLYLYIPTLLISRLTNNLYNTSLATFTIGSIITGILEIYGTTSDLVIVYLVCGGLMMVTSLLCLNKNIETTIIQQAYILFSIGSFNKDSHSKWYS